MAIFSKSIRSVAAISRWTAAPIVRSSQRALTSTSTSVPGSTSHPESMPLPPQPDRTTNTTTPGGIRPERYSINSSSSPILTQSTNTFIPRHPALSTRPPPARTEPIVETELDHSIKSLLPLLCSQPPFYATIQIHGKPYLVTKGDTVRLPFLMQGVETGDILRFNRVTIIGSRDYTLKAGTTEHKGEKQKYLDERLYVVRARVVGVTQEPVRVKIKKVRRRRHAKHTWSQHTYTVLRVTEVEARELEETEQAEGI
jgi:large subunit ribosomal protein L21